MISNARDEKTNPCKTLARHSLTEFTRKTMTFIGKQY